MELLYKWLITFFIGIGLLFLSVMVDDWVLSNDHPNENCEICQEYEGRYYPDHSNGKVGISIILLLVGGAFALYSLLSVIIIRNREVSNE